MRTYTIRSYYACYCGGTFYVDLRAESRGIYPCVYSYLCNRCGAHKSMPAKEEIEFVAKLESAQQLQQTN